MEEIIYNNKSVFVGDEFASLQKHLSMYSSSKIILLIDQNVFNHFGHYFQNFDFVLIPSGEASKTMNVAETLIEELISKGLDRSGFLVGVGGGVVCDLTGFVASIFMRGIKFAFVPTTLLAQVDAAIGGKNGVNLGQLKNMIGTFTQPEFIINDLNFLNTLPQNELVSGLAEVVKHACIRDRSYFHFLENHTSQILSRDKNVLYEVVLQSVRIKSQVVEADERESGLRKILNFGHTFGHAIEKLYNIPHGEAVSLGIILVNKIAVSEKTLSPIEAIQIEQLLSNFGLPTDLNKIDVLLLENLVFKDKKRQGNLMDFILLKEIGAAEIVPRSLEEIRKLIQADGYFH